jgi:hypothetical protein
MGYFPQPAVPWPDVIADYVSGKVERRGFDVLSRENSAGSSLRPNYYCFGLKAEQRRIFPCARMPRVPS